MTIAVLALQGAFLEHEKMLEKLNADCFEIRQARDLKRHYDGLILPGGESTVMRKLLTDLRLYQPLRDAICSGIPVFGTCAGLILLAQTVKGGSPCFGTMNITVRRNAYGRQLGSFYTEESCGSMGEIPMTFIRAPYIEQVDDSVEILASVNGKIVAARQDNQLVTAFHPELNEDMRVHTYFLDMVTCVF